MTILAFHENTAGCGQSRQSAIVTFNCKISSSLGGSTTVSSNSNPNSASVSPCTVNAWVPSARVHSQCSSGEYISPDSFPRWESIANNSIFFYQFLSLGTRSTCVRTTVYATWNGKKILQCTV